MNQLTLSALNKIIRDCLDANLAPSYWVIAEISELRVNQKGHCYLELIEKQEDDILARARATIWSYAYRNLSTWFEAATGESLRPGLKILANVTVGFHEVYGLSLNIRDIDASFTAGERALRRQEIMKMLIRDGVADMNKELPLPQVPQRIAVISAPAAAGYQDFMEQLGSNAYGYKFLTRLFPAVMQGKEAELSIIRALLTIYKKAENYDLIVLIRGGGAVTDLECFDNYNVASHIAQFPLPVITGIGHERDETIVDRVANTRLKTPTAVAEFLIAGLRQFEETVDELFDNVSDLSKDILDSENNLIGQISENIRHLAHSSLTRIENRYQLLFNRFTYSSRNIMDRVGITLDQAARAIRQMSRNRIRLENEMLRRVEENLKLMDAGEIMKRGFSVTRKNGKPVKDAGEIREGDRLRTEFHNGSVNSIVSK